MHQHLRIEAVTLVHHHRRPSDRLNLPIVEETRHRAETITARHIAAADRRHIAVAVAVRPLAPTQARAVVRTHIRVAETHVADSLTNRLNNYETIYFDNSGTPYSHRRG